MEKNAQDWEIKFLSQIIYLLDMGRIDEWFNDANLLPEIAAYKTGQASNNANKDIKAEEKNKAN